MAVFIQTRMKGSNHTVSATMALVDTVNYDCKIKVFLFRYELEEEKIIKQ